MTTATARRILATLHTLRGIYTFCGDLHQGGLRLILQVLGVPTEGVVPIMFLASLFLVLLGGFFVGVPLAHIFGDDGMIFVGIAGALLFWPCCYIIGVKRALQIKLITRWKAAEEELQIIAAGTELHDDRKGGLSHVETT